MNILKDLFDEKIIKIISLFLENPGKKFFLSDVANSTKVNITTTFRILNKLSEKGFLKTAIFGKVRSYQLEYNEKTKELMKLLRKDEDPMQKFISSVSFYPRIKKIILDSKENNSGKIILVGEFIPNEKIDQIVNQIKEKCGFKINYVELSEEQYIKLREFKNYELEKKIIWEKPNQ